MPILNKCEKCNRAGTRSYDGHDFCELHYLQYNPERNVEWVLAKMFMFPPFRIKDRLELLQELNKHVPLSALDEYFENDAWYQRLKKESRFP